MQNLVFIPFTGQRNQARRPECGKRKDNCVEGSHLGEMEGFKRGMESERKLLYSQKSGKQHLP